MIFPETSVPLVAAPPLATVLLVDDDPTIRRVLCCGLELAGLRVETAADGTEALARLRAQAFDWVVTDIVMPDCDGIELVQLARRQQPAVRIVAMSGGGGRASNYLKMAQHLGAAHVLQKPFGYADLVALIKAHGPASPRGAACA